MRVCVVGLWHLGTVTAASLASAGHDVVAFDPDPDVISRLEGGETPVREPGLDALIRSPRLRFTADPREALATVDVVWVTYDTPVDDDDRADVELVITRIESLFDHLADGTLVVISSQLPAGSTRRIEQSFAGRKYVSFAYSPENLRLGKAIDAFMKPDRVVCGVRDAEARRKFAMLMEPITKNIEWMSVESAEMTKHALNAFLATSVTFINEIAVICEKTGADAREVERGLKTDSRIGARAYLSPGAAFAGGTLARDVQFLATLGGNVPLLSSVKVSNDVHQSWPLAKLIEALGDLRGRTIAVWGLTYKPGTDTLRRSAAVELSRVLAGAGARVRAYDPAVHEVPGMEITVCASAEEAVKSADALVVATQWPQFRSVPSSALPQSIVVVDANRFLTLPPHIRHIAVGTPS